MSHGGGHGPQRARALGLLLGLLTACEPAASGSAPPSSSSSPSSRLPEPGPRPEAAVAPAVCLAHEAAADGACLSLELPGALLEPKAPELARRLPPEALLAVRGEAELVAWGKTRLRAPELKALTGEADAARSADGAFGALAPTLATARAGLVKIPEGDAPTLFGLVVLTAEPRTLRLTLGARGRVDVFAGERRLARVEREGGPAPLVDEHEVRLALPRGATPLWLLARSSKEEGAFVARLLDERRAPPRELRVAPLVRPLGAAPITPVELSELLEVTLAHEPRPGGFVVSADVALRGLAPARAEASLELALLDGGARVLAPLALHDVPGDALSRGVTLSAFVSGGSLEPTRKSPPSAHAPSRARLGLRSTHQREGARLVRWQSLAYRGALHERAVSLEGALSVRGRAPHLGAATLSARVWHDEVLAALGGDKLDVAWAEARVSETEALVRELEEGRDPLAARSGVLRRAYVSRLDGRPRPYLLYVPKSALSRAGAERGARVSEGGAAPATLPAIVTLHGMFHRAEHALRAVTGQAHDRDTDLGAAARHLPPIADQKTFLLAPSTFGDAGPRPIGERDVLDALDDATRHHPIDPRRVSITGYSLGGTSAFTIPLRSPGRFAAAAPLCGYPNLLTYQSVLEVPHAPFEEALLAQRYVGHYAENGLHLPLFPVHGGQDGPARSQVIVDRYRALGQRVEFDLQDDLDHNVWDHAYEDGRMIARLRRFAVPERPRKVRLATGDYRVTEAHWVRIDALRPTLFERTFESAARVKTEAFADVVAEVDEGGGTVTVTTRNVDALELDLSRAPVAARPRVVVDGVSLGEASADAKVAVVWRAGAPSRVDALPSRRGLKRRGVSGPLDDAQHHPLLFVVGTLRDDERDANLRVARFFAEQDAWEARYPVRRDVDVGPDELRGRTLVLLGGPRSNALTASLASALPVRFEEGALVVRGQRFEGESVGVSFVTESPFDADEYVVVHAGVSARGTLLSRNLPRLAPDFLVYDERLAARRGELLLAGRPVLAGGLWDERFR